MSLTAVLSIVIAIVVGSFVGAGIVRMRTLGERVRQLEAETVTDPLTGAFNRRHLDACLTHAIERRNRLGERASLLLFDVDRFKEINDSHGHAAGDDVLRRLVRAVARRARRMDVLFRIGGEEFALLLAGTSSADALAAGEDIRASVESARLLGARAVTISIGVSELADGQSAQDWIAEADEALYAAKRRGRNRVADSRRIALYESPSRVVLPKEIDAIRPM
jgi:diguanylate cyclase (GGDEF)-like protein